jgi:hypothetical protein
MNLPKKKDGDTVGWSDITKRIRNIELFLNSKEGLLKKTFTIVKLKAIVIEMLEHK